MSQRNRADEVCPVAALAREAQRLETACCAADEGRDTVQADQIEKQLNATRAAISHLQPKSKAGARYQIELIGILADAMIDGTRHDNFETFRAIERMTGVVTEFLAG